MIRKSLIILPLVGLLLSGCADFDCCIPGVIRASDTAVKLGGAVNDFTVIRIDCPLDWQLQSTPALPAWLEVTPDSKTADPTDVTLTAKLANTLAPRSHDLLFVASNGDRIKVTVTQYPPYNITITNDGKGTASANRTTASADAIISLNATPNAYYESVRWKVVSPAGLTLSGVTDNPATFTMPAHDVVIQATFEIAMVFVAGGAFTMGAPVTDTDAFGFERPTHLVSLDDFYIGKYEVTQAQWMAIMNHLPNPSRFSGNDFPIEQVTWDDIVGTSGASEVIHGTTYYEDGFIYKLNQATGKKYRLPTESEWEYAARGGQNSLGYLYSGSNNLGDVAWYLGNGLSTTHPVGMKDANELGIFDMSGNVYEWCSDLYGDYDPSPKVNPKGAAISLYRVFRGGSWRNNPVNLRVTYRNAGYPYNVGDNIGFRLACSLE